MPEKKIVDIIQEILDKNGKLFMKLSELPKNKLGLKKSSTVTQIHKYLEAKAGNNFMFKKVSSAMCIIKPCDPSEFVLAVLSTTKPKSLNDVKASVSLLNKRELAEVLNDLISQGKVQTTYTKDLQPRLIRTDLEVHETVSVNKSVASSKTYTQEKFKEAFDELNKYRRFVRICDLRRALNWPREVFDNMIKKLRDAETIQLHSADVSLMTPDEVKDCFVDENNFVRGLVNWNVR